MHLKELEEMTVAMVVMVMVVVSPAGHLEWSFAGQVPEVWKVLTGDWTGAGKEMVALLQAADEVSCHQRMPGKYLVGRKRS
jgi:hypothetical protein